MKTNGSNVWPYVIAGSAIGGALGYLLVTDSGRKIRRGVMHPDELAGDLEGARHFVEQKTRLVTERVHAIIDKARRGIEEGQRAYHTAGSDYRSRARLVENRNDEITSNVHNTVDTMSRTAVSVEQSVMDPICEMGALYRGVEQGIRALFGKRRSEGPIPIQRESHIMGK